MEEKIYVSVPLDVQFLAGSVNELEVRQNRNYLTHWCCENKILFYLFSFYTYPILPKCGLHLYLKQ